MRFLLVISLSFALLSCSTRQLRTEGEFKTWLNDGANGFQKSHTINDLTLSVKYMPPQLLAWKELKEESYTKSEMDSLTEMYAHSLAFLLTIKPTENEVSGRRDIMYHGIQSPESYLERYELLNFKISEYISLETEATSYKPILHTLENTYGITDYRNIYLVFSETKENGDLLSSKFYDLIFNDLIFETGITHYKFSRNEITAIPKLKFID